MSLSSSISWLKMAQEQHFAVGAFNANTLEQLQAIVSAAQEEFAPVIIQFSRRALEYIGEGDQTKGLRYVGAIGGVAAESATVPVIIHLDHGSESDVLLAMECGFTSVMYDGSTLPYDENIRHTRKLADKAHVLGICFEAELGEVGRLGVPGQEVNELTDPNEAKDFVARTGIDILAVSLGSLHAMKSKEVELDLNRLDAIRARVAVPMVLHGSSGVKDSSIIEGIRRGLCKVNVATQLNQKFSETIHDYLMAHPTDVDPRKYLGPARNAMKEEVRARIRLFGSAGKARA